MTLYRARSFHSKRETDAAYCNEMLLVLYFIVFFKTFCDDNVDAGLQVL